LLGRAVGLVGSRHSPGEDQRRRDAIVWQRSR
jgi:hypothetical protein